MSFYLRSAPHIVCLPQYIYCMFPFPNACRRHVVVPTVCPTLYVYPNIYCLSVLARLQYDCTTTHDSHDCNTTAHDSHDCNTTCRGECKYLHYVMHVIGSSMLCGVVGMSCWDRHTCYNQHVCLYMYMHVNNTTCRVGSNTTCHNQHVGVFVHACQQHDMSCWVQDRMPTTRHVVLGTDVL
jgi:hypothetical protein